tara:strand:- start:37 stop:198 length:162 start_codon:yes stop_codon:yes gene_type:complete
VDPEKAHEPDAEAELADDVTVFERFAAEFVLTDALAKDLNFIPPIVIIEAVLL